MQYFVQLGVVYVFFYVMLWWNYFDYMEEFVDISYMVEMCICRVCEFNDFRDFFKVFFNGNDKDLCVCYFELECMK